MSDHSASFKVTLHRGCSSETEVRRLVLPPSALSSYSILRDKLQVVFQSIKNQPFEVTWEDNEGDRVMVSSDEELMIAIKEMSGDVYRLRIDVGKPRNADLHGSERGGPLHSSVTCDVCSEDIRGFRYKCIQCPNYDLCAQCEMNQHHKGHFMIRIPEPISWKPEFGHRLVHHMSKSARKHRGAGLGGEARGRGNSQHHHSCHYHDYGSSAQRYQIPQFVQQIFRNMWDPNATHPEPQGEAAATPSADTKKDQKEDGHVTYLKTIGETVASLLDPLGIDVNIEVKTKKDEDENSGTNKGESVDKKKSENDEKLEENLQEASGISSKCESPAVKPEKKSPEMEANSLKREKGELDSDEWTVITEDTLPKADKVEPGKDSSSGTKSKPTEQHLGTPLKNIISGEKATAPVSGPHYPNLNFIHEEQRNPNLMRQPISHNVPFLYPMASYPGQNVAAHHPPIPTPIPLPIPPPGPVTGQVNPHAPTPAFHQISHTRPHINHSLGLMAAMGFNNEGGWLTSLLEAVNGDVSKALDILQPVKK